MKYYDLDQEELEILKAIEEGKVHPVADQAGVKRRLEEAARNTLNKTKNINIRLSERTLARLKAKAAAEGIPYQTLVASILHRFTASG